jgi:glutathione S-transferase
MKALVIPFTDRIEPFTKPVNWEEFRAFSPIDQVSVLIDGDRTIWDSLGTTLYLADRHPNVWPRDDALTKDIARICEIFEETLA